MVTPLDDVAVSTLQAVPSKIRPAIRAVSDRRLAAWIFAILWATVVFFGPGGSVSNPNTVSRIAPIYSLLQHRTLRIDAFAPYTIDKAVVGDHFYSDKAPGQMLFALPFVGTAMLAAHAIGASSEPIVDGHFTRFFGLSVWIAAAFTASLFTAAAAAALYLFARHLGTSQSGALLASLGFGFCTPALGWASVLFSHAMAGGCLFLAFATIMIGSDERAAQRTPWRTGLITGALLGLAILTEFTAALPGLVIGAATLARLRKLPRADSTRLIAAIVIGGLPFALTLGLYNFEAFGSATHLGYDDVVGFDGMKQGFFGISIPRFRVVAMLMIAPHRGILWFAPWLVFLPWACLKACRTWPLEVALTAALVPVCYLLINGGYFYWDGGWSTGPRHMIAGTSFACLAFDPLWDAASRHLRTALIGLASVSAAISLICVSVDMTDTSHLMFPLVQEFIPRFAAGDVHNMAASAGLTGLASLLPMIVVWIIPVFLYCNGLAGHSGAVKASPPVAY